MVRRKRKESCARSEFFYFTLILMNPFDQAASRAHRKRQIAAADRDQPVAVLQLKDLQHRRIQLQQA